MEIKSMDARTFIKEQIEVLKVFHRLAKENGGKNPSERKLHFQEYCVKKIGEYEKMLEELDGGSDDE